jgi:hypothetical protein
MSCHLCGNLFDVFLSLYVDSGDSGQINDSEVRTIVGVDAKFDGIIHDLSSFTGHLVRQFLDVAAHITKIGVGLSSCVILKNCVGFAISFS